MKFETFVKQKKDTWNRLNALIEANSGASSKREEDLSEMVRLYRSISADYAYAKANYPYDRVVIELNTLMGKAHAVIYGSQPFRWKKLSDFFFSEFPNMFRHHFRFSLCAFLIFLVAAIFAFIGSLSNPQLPQYILGDYYVNMTLENIQKNDPFAVYKQADSPVMSSFIMTNNIKVTFFAYGMGILAGVGTIYVMFYNGLMLGVFFFVFFEHNLLTESVATVMLHGTIELTCIFIAGGAGLLIGKALVFPESYSRREALKIYGFDSIKLILGAAPLLIIAGLIEGFVTRMDMTIQFKMTFIVANVCFLIWYLALLGKERKKTTLLAE
ncbi:stage II sporulation protein M [bacterium]|nr:stage II sporulation protein M [bacterium]